MNVRWWGAVSIASMCFVMASPVSAQTNDAEVTLYEASHPEEALQGQDTEGLIKPVSHTSCATETQAGCMGDCYGTGDCPGNGSCLGGTCGDGGCCYFSLKHLYRTDRRWDSFISPLSNSFHFEDPRNMTEARFLFQSNNFPGNLGGESAQLYTLQLRAAVTERLSLITTKGGYFVSVENDVVDDGWSDFAFGLKYNFISDYQNRFILSGGATYEAPVGERRAVQGNGDGLIDVFITGAKDLGCGYNFMSATGFLIPLNGSEQSSLWYGSAHVDHYIGSGLFWLAEVNWFHWMASGDHGVNGFNQQVGVEGLDLFNVGALSVAGNDIVTGAIGLKWKPTSCHEIGLGVEFPLTDRQDILDTRAIADWRIRY